MLDPDIEAADVTSLMASPLMVKGRVAGVVEVATRGARRFTLEEESLLILMADRAGLAIEHARAYERELSNVEMLQRSLLPDKLPEIDGIQVAARYMPGGADVGGDWYDAIPLDGGRVGVAMGDVVGHGIGAAALMGQLRHAMRAYALEGHPPAGVLDRLDRVVRSLEGGQMATLLYLVMEPDHGTVSFASAGHVPPLVISPDGEAAYLDSAPNPPLGVFESPEHKEMTTHLPPGSTIVLYTDGLVEERGVSIDQGLEALRLAASQDACHPRELCDGWSTRCWRSTRPTTTSPCWRCGRCRRRRRRSTSSSRRTRPSSASMRRDLGDWLREAGAAGEVVEIIQMACHEACSNAIEHGYSFGEGVALGRRGAEGRPRAPDRARRGPLDRAPRRPAALPRQRPAADARADGHGRADARERRRDGGADGADAVSRQSCRRRVANGSGEGGGAFGASS